MEELNKIMSINIKLLKKKPHKLYSIDLTSDAQIKVLCKFLRDQKDRKLEVKINGKNIKFDSIAGRKRFVAGFQSASKIINQSTHHDQIKSQKKIQALNRNIKELEKQVLKEEEEKNKWIGKVRVHQTVNKLRKEAWEDTINELQDNCEILNLKFKASNDIVKAIKKAKSLEDLKKIQEEIK